MAINDLKQYYFTMLSQYLEEKKNLADFEQALKDGYITEEQMQEAINTVRELEVNYHRMTYVMYLLNMPARSSKKTAYVKQHKTILEALKRLGADEESVKANNEDALCLFKQELNKLKNKGEL